MTNNHLMSVFNGRRNHREESDGSELETMKTEPRANRPSVKFGYYGNESSI